MRCIRVIAAIAAVAAAAAANAAEPVDPVDIAAAIAGERLAQARAMIARADPTAPGMAAGAQAGTSSGK